MSASGRRGRTTHHGRGHGHHSRGQQQQGGGAPTLASSNRNRFGEAVPRQLRNNATSVPLYAREGNKAPAVHHKPWPELPNQAQGGDLFTECTLFLYSVLALFLNYLNIYRTLWWLPKSYWHHSIKLHLINPYLLSCLGLLLGFRVTRCFWNGITERVDRICVGRKSWSLTGWKIVEYACIKTPLATIVSCSFVFSFSRIAYEFGLKSLVFFTYPLVNSAIYATSLIGQFGTATKSWIGVVSRRWSTSSRKGIAAEVQVRLEELGKIITNFASFDRLLDLNSNVHVCVDDYSKIREEARTLWADLLMRSKRCVFSGLFIAYFAVLMPRIFIPERTQRGEAQYMLVNDVWTAQLCAVVALTGISLSTIHLFPIHYFDLLHRCAVHLGSWKRLATQRQNTTYLQESAISFDAASAAVADGTICISSASGDYFQAQCLHPEYKRVAAEPDNEGHRRLAAIARDPVLCSTYMCLFQAILIGLQFWMLILTTDWLQLATLVLLMFANYLLLARIFKDRVVIGRIYRPSSEDRQLPVKLLLEESQGNSARNA